MQVVKLHENKLNEKIENMINSMTSKMENVND